MGNFLTKNLKLNKKKYKIYFSHNYKLRFLDFKQQISIVDKLSPNLIINCSGFTNVDLAENNKKTAKNLNYQCVKYLSKYCQKNNIILIHFSTDYVFSGRANFYEPHHKCEPINYYGYTKYLGEKEIKKLKFKYYIFRISWLLSSNKFSFLKKIKRKIESKKKINVIYDSFSCPTTVIFINKFLQNNMNSFFTKNNIGIYHLVNPVSLSFYQLAKIIEKIVSKKRTSIINKIKYNDYYSIAKRPKISKLSIKKTIKYFNVPKNYLINDIKKLIK